jgi:hypothetical protein
MLEGSLVRAPATKYAKYSREAYEVKKTVRLIKAKTPE